MLSFVLAMDAMEAFVTIPAWLDVVACGRVVSSSLILGCVFLVQWSQSGADIVGNQEVDLRPHPAGRRWAGSQPSSPP